VLNARVVAREIPNRFGDFAFVRPALTGGPPRLLSAAPRAWHSCNQSA